MFPVTSAASVLSLLLPMPPHPGTTVYFVLSSDAVEQAIDIHWAGGIIQYLDNVGDDQFLKAGEPSVSLATPAKSP
jgi:hypothetical protein